jgi:hypothetical protein
MRRRLRALLVRGALPKVARGLRHSAVGNRLQARSQGLTRRINGLTRRQGVVNRRAAMRQVVAHRQLRAAFRQAAFAAAFR